MSTGANSSTGAGSSGKRIPEFAASLLGSTIDGRFRIDQAIGQGAMGTVFAATQLSVHRKVAVKVLREQMSDNSKARFLREARAISSLSHPNIVQLIDFGERAEDGLLYLVMEYVEGLRMSRLNKKGRLHPNMTLELMSQISGALAEAHAQGIIHRDLKPSNILLVLSADGSVQLKVLDFGVAHTYEDAGELTATGVLCGTPAYMAPEQAAGKDVTPRIDLYALGVNMYEMLVGFRPFSGATPVEVAMKQIQAPPPSLRPWIDQGLIPPQLAQLCEELLDKDPTKRPQSASELRRRILSLRGDLGWGPVVVQGGEDPWKNWTQPKLGEHGGKPLKDGPDPGRMSGSWSGSWTGHTGAALPNASQAALHDRSGSGVQRGLEPGMPPAHAEPQTQDSHPSQDSLPSRHGGGWDAFRGTDGTGGSPAHAHHMGPAPTARPPQMQHSPDDTASPSQETEYIYQASQSASQAGAAPPSAAGGPHSPHGQPQHTQAQPMSPDTAGQIPAQQVPGSTIEEPVDFIERTAASYEGMWQGDPGSSNGALPTFSDAQRLDVDRPIRRDGTTVHEAQPSEGLSTTDLIRFGAVALLVFLICAVIGVAILNPQQFGLEPDPVPTGEDPEAAAMVPPDTELDPVEEEEVVEKETPKKAPRKKKKEELKKKKWKEPIDLFDEPVEDAPDRKIVIERGK